MLFRQKEKKKCPKRKGKIGKIGKLINIFPKMEHPT